MAKTKLSGKVQTVLGPIEPEALGATLTHEHMLIDLSYFKHVPDEASDRWWMDAPVTMENRNGIIRRTHFSRPNFQMLDEREAIKEVAEFRYASGGSLVDATSIGIARDPLALARISRAVRLNIVMGSSYYVPFSWPADMGSRSEASITQQIVRDITVGVGETGVRSGIIGEIGNYWPMDDTQAKVLRASARAQVETGAAILIHPGLDTLSPPQILDTLTKAGANHGRIIIGHMDHFEDVGMFREIVRRGSYIEWDIFGYEDTSWTGLGRQTKMTRWATDVERMEWIEVLIAEGFGKQIVIAHDECLKIHRKQYGGKGYGHIMENIVPRMRKRGFTEEHINDILVENPKRILTFE